MSSIIAAMNTALFSTLSGGTALVAALGGTFIYDRQAPDNAPLPYVVFSMQAGGPDNTSPSDLHDNYWYVRAYTATGAQGGTIDALIDALLDGKALTVTGWRAFWCVRDSDVALVETLQDRTRVYSTGGVYRIRLAKS